MQVRHLPVLVKLRQCTACLDPTYGVTSFSFPLSNAGVRVGVCTPAEELEPFVDFGVDGNCVHSIALTCFLNEFLGGGLTICITGVLLQGCRPPDRSQTSYSEASCAKITLLNTTKSRGDVIHLCDLVEVQGFAIAWGQRVGQS